MEDAGVWNWLQKNKLTVARLQAERCYKRPRAKREKVEWRGTLDVRDIMRFVLTVAPARLRFGSFIPGRSYIPGTGMLFRRR